MTTTDGRPRTAIRAATLRGCELALLHLPPLAGVAGVGASCVLLQLDRPPHTYSLTLTGAELAALARLNPDDARVPDAALTVLAHLALATTTLTGDWQMLMYHQPGAVRPECAATLTPIHGDELTTLGRLAAELIAAAEAGAR